MSWYSTEKQRRVVQFAQALKPMHRRTVRQVKGCCYLILEERDSGADYLGIKKAAIPVTAFQAIEVPVFALTSDHGSHQFITCGPSENAADVGWNSGGWRVNEQSNRFVQFVFLEKHFELDLPRPMLYAAEASEILRRRSGFQYLADRLGPDDPTVKYYHPLRKSYVHGDVITAAEDIAWIYFDLWRFPVDSKLYLTTFGGRYEWENGRPFA